MPSIVSNKQVIFTKIPTTFPVDGEHIQVQETTIDLEKKLPKGSILLKTIVVSVDPYMRASMRDPSIKSYSPAYELGKVIGGDTMSVVIESNNPNYKVEDLVYGRTGLGLFSEYVEVTAEYAAIAYVVRNDAKKSKLPLENYVGALSMPGLTAYSALKEISKPKVGDTLFVSAASGAVGQLVGQFGKAAGLYVVGSAGTDEKVDYLKSIGFDDAFNYKKGSISDNLAKTCPHGIDVYFDNVGGEMLDTVLVYANDFARIIACGMISQYNLEKLEPLYNSILIITKRLKIEGFIILDHYKSEQEFLEKVTPLLVNGKIKYKYDIAYGITKVPESLIKIFEGKNFGKQVIYIDPFWGNFNY